MCHAWYPLKLIEDPNCANLCIYWWMLPVRFSHSKPEDCRDTVAGQVDALLVPFSTANKHAIALKTFEVNRWSFGNRKYDKTWQNHKGWPCLNNSREANPNSLYMVHMRWHFETWLKNCRLKPAQLLQKPVQKNFSKLREIACSWNLTFKHVI